MPHFATLVGSDTAITGYPYFFSCSCGVQARFAQALNGAQFCGLHFSGQNVGDVFQFTDSTGNSFPVLGNNVQDQGSLPQMTAGIQY